MKKLIVILMSLLMLVFLVSCDLESDKTPAGNESVSESVSATTPGEGNDDATVAETETEAATEALPTVDDLLGALEEQGTTALNEDVQINVEASVDMTATVQGVSQTQAMNVGATITVDGSNLALSLTIPGMTEPMVITYADNTLYLALSADEKVACSASEEEVNELMAEITEELASAMKELEEMEIPGLEELLTTFSQMKPSQLVAQSTLTVDPATGDMTVVMSGLSTEAVTAFNALIDIAINTMAGAPMTAEDTPADEMSAMITVIKGMINDLANPENFSITMVYDKDLRMKAIDLHLAMDLTAVVAAEEEGASCIMTLDLGVDATYADQTVAAPADAASYPTMSLEELVEGLMENFGGNGPEEMASFCNIGVLTELSGQKMEFTYVEYDEEFNEIETTVIIFVPDEMMDTVTPLLGTQVIIVATGSGEVLDLVSIEPFIMEE